MNKRDIVTRALQRIQVTGVEDAPEAHQTELGLETLAQAIADLNGVYGCTLPFTIDQAIPSAYQTGMINMVAARLAHIFERVAPEPEITAMMRVRAVNMPYVRDMDLDDNGEVTDCEVDAIDRSTFY